MAARPARRVQRDRDRIDTAFRADPENCRLLCYTNAATLTHNIRIRAALLGRTATPFIVGERCVVRSPVIALSAQGESTIRIPVNSEPTVLEHRDGHAGAWHRWPAPGRTGGTGASLETLTLPVWRMVLAHDGAEKVAGHRAKTGNAERYNLLRIATELSNAGTIDRRIKEALNDIRHVHAITTHTAQGSTYPVTFVDMTDMTFSGMLTRLERLKLLYTACTRPNLALGVSLRKCQSSPALDEDKLGFVTASPHRGPPISLNLSCCPNCPSSHLARLVVDSGCPGAPAVPAWGWLTGSKRGEHAWDSLALPTLRF